MIPRKTRPVPAMAAATDRPIHHRQPLSATLTVFDRCRSTVSGRPAHDPARPTRSINPPPEYPRCSGLVGSHHGVVRVHKLHQTPCAADRDGAAEPGDRLSQRQPFKVDHRLRQSPARRSAASISPSAASTLTDKPSIRRSRSRRCPAWASNAARRAACRIDRSPIRHPSQSSSSRRSP